ncbi:restriction endonuclease [Leptolyngbya sp. PL-A3]|uniref:restriction endonuclease n=1 Tax=Leptolyngbya sp. PL-A3 TaxID=2933911 RepID=UPI0032997287
MSLDSDTLMTQFCTLDSLPADAPAAAKRRRGQEFEVFLHNLLAASDLDPRTRYRPEGEEIDGSFELSGRVYLLEAKWHRDPLPASAIYAFKGKVDGKLTGTLGVFVSMSGYSEDAIEALTLGKTLNVILADRDDVLTALANKSGIRGVLRTKLRAAAEQGTVYYRVSATQLTVGGVAGHDATQATVEVAATNDARPTSLVIVCEGPRDEVALTILTQRILEREKRAGDVRLVVAMGKHNIPRVLNAIRRSLPDTAGFVAVADGDEDPEHTRQLIAEQLEDSAEIVVVNPGLEAWFTPFVGDPTLCFGDRRKWRSRHWEAILQVQMGVDLLELSSAHPTFQQFYNLVVRHSRVI